MTVQSKYPFAIVAGQYRPIREAQPAAANAAPFSSISESKVKQRRIFRESVLGNRDIFDSSIRKVAIERLLGLRSFGEVKTFFEKTKANIPADSFEALQKFIDNNLMFFGPDYSFDDNAMQILIDILIGQKTDFKKLASGGEGAVYQRSDESPPSEKQEVSPELVALQLNELAFKVLLKGEYDEKSQEVQNAKGLLPGFMEVSCVRSITPPNTVSQRRALVMKLGEQAIDKYLKEEKDMGKRLVAVLQVAEKVAELHEAGFIHRDLKPANALRLADGTVRLIDSSFVKKLGEIVDRHPSTMIHSSSPETVPGLGKKKMEVDFSFDIWSIGVMLYEAVTTPYTDLGEVMAFAFKVMTGTYLKQMFPSKSSIESLALVHEPFEKVAEQVREEVAEQVREEIAEQGQADELDVEKLLKEAVEDVTDEFVLDIAMDAEDILSLCDGEELIAKTKEYLSLREKFVLILKKPVEDLNMQEIEGALEFVSLRDKRRITDYSAEIIEIEDFLKDALIMRKFELYPALEAIAKRLLSQKPSERGSANDVVQEMSEFLYKHPELI